MRFVPLVVCVIVAASFAPAAARQDQPPAPTFRTGVELLTVQAAVVDDRGRAVEDLQASEFLVRVDGAPRKVLFARFYRAEGPPVGAPGAATPVGGTAANTHTANGRVIVFVVDRDSIRSEADKVAFEAASSILDTLTPADAVGLLSLPAGGVEVTRDHAAVRSALQKMTGSQAAYTPERDTREPLWAIQGLARKLQGIRAPTHVILISAGLPFSMDLLPDYQMVAREAARAGLVLHAVHLDQGASGAGDRLSPSLTPRNSLGRPGDAARRESDLGGRELGGGLTTLAGMTGGTFFNAIARGTGVFERISTVINNFYELGIESSGSDSSGKPRKLTIDVNRRGVSVRAPEQVFAPRADAGSASDPLLQLLRQPTDVAELPITVTTFTTRGGETASLRFSMSAEIGTGGSRGPGEWLFVVFNKDGKLVAEGRQTLEATARRPWAATVSAQLAPGGYTMRVAAIDGDQRSGLLTAPLTIGLRALGPLQASELILGTAEGARNFQPASRFDQGTGLVGLIELLSGDPAMLARSRAVFEIIAGGATEPVQRVLMASRGGASETVLMNEARVTTSTLAPGRYTASVVALVDNQPVGRVSRAFEIVGK